jgi:hypothetical protein
MLSRDEVKKIREQYPAGTLIELASMKGERQMTEGLRGYVTMVDDAGQIHMQWSNSSSLALVAGVDKFRVIDSPRLVDCYNQSFPQR